MKPQTLNFSAIGATNALLAATLLAALSISPGVAFAKAKGTAERKSSNTGSALTEPMPLFATDATVAHEGGLRLVKRVCRHWPGACDKGNGAILPRGAFLRAHPESQLDTANAKVHKAPLQRRMIPSVQESLESNARPSAIILDCKVARSVTPDKEPKLSNCGLYLYDRDHRSVVASSVRYFGVPVGDPSSWAGPLVETFEKGLSARSRLDDERVLNEFYARNALENVEEETSYVIGLSPGFTRTGSSAIGPVPRLQASVGRTYGSHLFSLFATYARATAPETARFRELRGMGGGLEFSLRADALEVLTWELGLRSGFERIRYLAFSEAGSTDALLFGVRPGVLASVGKRVRIGPSLGLNYRVPLSATGGNATAAPGGVLSGGSLEPALNIEFAL